MFFDKNKTIEAPDYGSLVSRYDLMKEIEKILKEKHVIFEPDYMDDEYVKLVRAEEVLMALKMIK